MRRTRFAGFVLTAGIAVGLIAGSAGTAVAQQQVCANADAVPGSVPNASLAASLTCLINVERGDRGLSQLTPDSRLTQAEQAHINDMMQNRFLGHRGTDGSLPAERVRRTGFLNHFKAFVVGENLAWGQTTVGTPRAVFNAWMADESHRRNILLPRYLHISTIVATGSPTGVAGSALDPNAATYGTLFGVVKKG